MTARFIMLGVTLATAAAGCGTSPTSPADTPTLPISWAAAVTNPYFPLAKGTTYRYSGQTATGLETIVLEILPDIKVVNGVSATVVRDRVYLAGNLVEDTIDWYAQDAAGNVWYLGESVKDIVNGQVVSTEGSFEWGVDGALPGIIMWGDPAAHQNEDYRQEYYKGHAEDYGKVLAVGVSVTVPYGSVTGCVRIEEWNALVREPRTSKTYCPALGITLELGASGKRVELVSVTRP